MTKQYPHDRLLHASEPIALIGIGCHLPGNITSSAGLLQALTDGRDLITEIPPERWNVDAYFDPDPLAPGKTYVRKGGFVQDVDRFDAGFFNISDAEAARMDPQQRLVLQTVWHALEDAGQPAEELFQSNTGVFLAMMNTNGYSQLKGVYEGPLGITAYDAMGDAMSITAGRISHFLGLEGPCLTLDTACSSSLVALHLARQSILAGDCDMAIVAGVNLILHPGIHVAFSKVGLMSRLGRCATFDASADGYIRGEGCMAVIIRRQSQAVARGDRIIASIVGTAVNQDGRTPAVTAPNGRSQEKVIRSALARVGVSPSEVGYLEAHGTGTPVGDPIEMSAIVNVYGPGREGGQPLYVGSIKSNFGHIEAGAGLLGLAKAALSLQTETIFPSLHFKQLNPNIDLGHAPVRVPGGRVAWPRQERPRFAGVNSFGYSGTNAHAILQEAPAPALRSAELHSPGSLMERQETLLVISAKSSAALDELADQYSAWLAEANGHSLQDIAFTAAAGRTQLSHRLAVTGSSQEELSQKLSAWRDGRTPRGLVTGQVVGRIRPRVAFMFTGQGAQYPDMGREFYASEARFAAAIQRVAAIMDPELGAPLLEVLYGERSAEYLSNTRYVQPALFAVEVALAEMLRYWGIEPDYVIGHSIGELAAAVVARALDLEDAARFVVARGRLMGELPPGGRMLAVGASIEQVQRWIQGHQTEISIATVNGPRAIVVSGTAEAVAAVEALAQAAGRQTKPLEVSHAFHSPLMDPILDDLTRAAAGLRFMPPQIPLLSNTRGDFFDDELAPEYWSQQVRQAVLFFPGMEKIIDAGATILVEIGPHPALTPAVASAFDAADLQTIPTLKRDHKDNANILGCLAALFANGAALRFDRLYDSPAYQKVALPLYPFRRERYWLPATNILEIPPESFRLAFGPETQPDPAEAPDLPALPDLHPLLGKAVTHTARRTVFETGLKTTSPWTDHRVLDTTVFPGTAYLEMAARGFAAASGQDWMAVTLKDVTFERPLLLSYREEKKIQLILEQPSNGSPGAKFTIAAAGDPATVYCRGRVAPAREPAAAASLETALAGRATEMPIGAFYGELRSRGLEYGARFANVRQLWQGAPGSGEAFGRINATPGQDGGRAGAYLNAAQLDACLHVFGAALDALDDANRPGAFVPAAIRAVTLQRELPAQVWSHVSVSASGDGRAALAAIRVLDDAGELLAEFDNLELRRALSLSAGGQPGRNNGKEAASTQTFKTRGQLVDMLQPLARKERIRQLSKWLATEIKDTLGQAADGLNIDRLPPSTAFIEIGLDSLLVTELQRRIQEKLEFRFKPMQGLGYQSIESLAEFIHDDVLFANQRETVIAGENQSPLSP